MSSSRANKRNPLAPLSPSSTNGANNNNPGTRSSNRPARAAEGSNTGLHKAFKVPRSVPPMIAPQPQVDRSLDPSQDQNTAPSYTTGAGSLDLSQDHNTESAAAVDTMRSSTSLRRSNPLLSKRFVTPKRVARRSPEPRPTLDRHPLPEPKPARKNRFEPLLSIGNAEVQPFVQVRPVTGTNPSAQDPEPTFSQLPSGFLVEDVGSVAQDNDGDDDEMPTAPRQKPSKWQRKRSAPASEVDDVESSQPVRKSTRKRTQTARAQHQELSSDDEAPVQRRRKQAAVPSEDEDFEMAPSAQKSTRSGKKPQPEEPSSEDDEPAVGKSTVATGKAKQRASSAAKPSQNRSARKRKGAGSAEELGTGEDDAAKSDSEANGSGAVDGEVQIEVTAEEPLIEPISSTRFAQNFPTAIAAAEQVRLEEPDWEPELGWQGVDFEDLPEIPDDDVRVVAFRRRFTQMFTNLINKTHHAVVEAIKNPLDSDARITLDVMLSYWSGRLDRFYNYSALQVELLDEYFEVIPNAVQRFLGVTGSYNFEEFYQLATTLKLAKHGTYFNWSRILNSSRVVSGAYKGSSVAGYNAVVPNKIGLRNRTSGYARLYQSGGTAGGYASDKAHAHGQFFLLEGAELNLRAFSVWEDVVPPAERWKVHLLETLQMCYTRTVECRGGKFAPVQVNDWLADIIPHDVPAVDWLPLNGTWPLMQPTVMHASKGECVHCGWRPELAIKNGAAGSKGSWGLLDPVRPWLGYICSTCYTYRKNKGSLSQGLDLARRLASLGVPAAAEDYALCKYDVGQHPSALTRIWTYVGEELVCRRHLDLLYSSKKKTWREFPAVLWIDNPEASGKDPHACIQCGTQKSPLWHTSWKGKEKLWKVPLSTSALKDWPYILCDPCARYFEDQNVDWRSMLSSELFGLPSDEHTTANGRPQPWPEQSGVEFKPSLMARYWEDSSAGDLRKIIADRQHERYKKMLQELDGESDD